MNQGISYGVLSVGVLLFVGVGLYFVFMLLRIKKAYNDAMNKCKDVKKYGEKSEGKIISVEKITQNYKEDDNTILTIEYFVNEEKIVAKIKCFIDESFTHNFVINETVCILYDILDTSRVVIDVSNTLTS